MLIALRDLRKCLVLAAIQVAAFVFCIGTVAADPPANTPSQPTASPPVLTQPESPTGSSAGSSGKVLAPKPSTDVQYLPGPNGELVPVPVGATLREYLDWLKTRGVNVATQPPDFGVISVELDGDAVVDLIRLRAKVRIQINRKDGWVRVPLRFDEAVLQSITHTGPGDALHEAAGASSGHDWWLQGAGIHELGLQCTIPLRKQGQTQRLQLQLPPSAIATLKLRISQPNAIAKVPEKVIARSRPIDDQASGRKLTEFDVSGFGTRLDLTWEIQSAASSAESVLEVANSIFASVVDGETVTQEVTQRVQALQGNFDELRVRLPGGSELLRLDAAESAGHSIDPADASLVVVKLKRVTAGPVELRWTVRSKSTAGDAQFVLDGFEVERARIQTGQVAVGLVGDFRLSKNASDDRFVQRINPSDLPPALRRSDVASAYRILNQPYRLSLAVEKLEPLVSVEPWHFLMSSADHLDLENVFVMNIRRGSVSEVVLRWTGEAGDGWNIVRVDPAARVEPINNFSDADAAVRLVRLRFAEPLRGTSELRVLTRKRAGEETTASEWPLSLPAVDTAYHSPATLLLAEDGSHNVIVEDAGVASISEITDLEALRVALPVNWPGGTARAVRLGAGNHQVTLRFADANSSEAASSGNGRKLTNRRQGTAGVRIARSWIRTEFTLDGGSMSAAVCRVTGAPTRLVITLPANSTPVSFSWDGPIEPIRITTTETERTVELDLRPTAAASRTTTRAATTEHEFTMKFQSDSDGESHFVGKHRLPLIRFGPEVAVGDVVWDIVLPSNRHLFTEPAGLAPLFTWRRENVFWTREAGATHDELSLWLHPELPPPGGPLKATGNRYLFRRLGALPESDADLTFSSMSQSAIVLFGAGLALFLGLVLIKVPATRNVLTGLVIAFAVAGLGLWQKSPILVLLQPAGLGVLLAVSAAVIDGWVKRRRNAQGLTITSPSGFVSPPSSIERQRAIGVGSNDFTALRPDPGAIGQQVTASEAGMRP